MKSFLSRLRGNPTPAPSRPSSASSQYHDKEKAPPPIPPPKKGGPAQSLPQRSLTPIAAMHSQSSSSASDSTRPRSALGQLEGDVEVWNGADEHGGRTVSASGEVAGKKVTFRSPAPTPTTSVVLEDFAQLRPDPTSEGSRGRKGSKMEGERSASASPKKPPVPPRTSKPTLPTRSSLPTAPMFVSSRKSSLQPARRVSQHTVPPQPLPAFPTKSSVLSPTPSDVSAGSASARSYLPPPNSWSEMAEQDLIANLGPKERTRQEVLWEIVSSEERYVQELIKLNETFCRALLPSSATSPSLNFFDSSNTLSGTLSAASPTSPTESFDHLPIACRYASTLSPSDERPTPPLAATGRMEAYQALTYGRPSHKSSFATLSGQGRSHHSLPPPSRSNNYPGATSFSATFNRMSNQSRVTSTSSATSITAKDVHLPGDLEKVLTVLAGGILEGHIKLAAALRRRYEDQYPLVRSLADVFAAHSYILREYATYVLHLESALAQVDSALSADAKTTSRRASRRLEETELGRLGKLLISLEGLAVDRGESGLVISLSKPFQRFLKYPLLFQNLLFNTDPSMKEYEATYAMVDEIEGIVRTIEDEKGSQEERERTRDVWARIEGLEKDKMLMVPRPDRLLLSETQLSPSEGLTAREVSVKQKKNLRRFSDIMKGSNENLELWVVRLSDVSLLCERTSSTQVPVSRTKSAVSKSDSQSELTVRAKSSKSARRSQSVKARNLYRFVRVHEWHLDQATGSGEGLSSAEDNRKNEALPLPTASPSSSSPPSPQRANKVPLKDDGGPSPARSTAYRDTDDDNDTVLSDHSDMSFAFKGSDQIRPKPRARHSSKTSTNTPTPTGARTASGLSVSRKVSGGHLAGSAANAKFAHRLRSVEDGDATIRPLSKTRRSLPPAMALASTDRVNSDAHARPAWNSSTNASKVASSSVRGIKSTAPSTSGGQTRPAVKPRVTPSLSEASEIVGMWNAYQNAGEATPAKRMSSGRQLGGRI